MSESRYAAELTQAMNIVGSDSNTLFVGQSVGYPGTAMFNTLRNISMSQRLELPVAEELQLGISLGLTLTGRTVVSIFPRWNFLLLAMNQLVNHVDKRNELFRSSTKTGSLLIRTSVGSERPLHPKSQHIGDFSVAVALMCLNIRVVRLEEPTEVCDAYREALSANTRAATILVEYGDYYNEK